MRKTWLLGVVAGAWACGSSGSSDAGGDASNGDETAAATSGAGSDGDGPTDDDGTAAADEDAVDETSSSTGSTSGAADTDDGDDTSTGSDDGEQPIAPDCTREPCTGDAIWTNGYGNADALGTDEYMNAMVTDAEGYTTISARVQGTADFGPAGVVDGPATVLLRIDPEGVPVWVRELAIETLGDIEIAPDGTLVLLATYPFEQVELVGVSPAGDVVFDETWAPTNGWIDAIDLAIAADGTIAVAGRFNGAVTFGGDLLVSTAASEDAFIVRFDDAFAHVWSRRFGDDEHQFATSVGFDADGNTLLVGSNSGTIDFGTTAHVALSNQKIWLASLAADDGEELWSRQLESSFYPSAARMLVDDDGFYLATEGAGASIAVDFGLGYEAGYFHLARFDFTGSVQWARGFGADYGIRGVARDGANGLVIVGDIDGTIDFGDGMQVSSFGDFYDVFIAKLTADGTQTTWTRLVSDDNQQSNVQRSVGVGVDAAGNVFAGGDFYGVFDLGLGDVSSGAGFGGTDLFLVKLEP